MKNAIINQYGEYNQRRYGTPWVCKITETGNYDFNTKVGCYTGNGNKGEAGDLIIFEPVEGMVYGYGQKDYRGGKTDKSFKIYRNGEFVNCDKLGR